MQSWMVAPCLYLCAVSSAWCSEESKLTAQQRKEAYWDCLANKAVQVLPRKMSRATFMTFIRGACPDRKTQFRTALTRHLELEFPNTPVQTHLAAADNAITLAVEDAASAYVSIESGNASRRKPAARRRTSVEHASPSGSRPQQLRKVTRPEDQRVRGSDDGKRPGVWTGPDFGSFPPWPLAPPDLSNASPSGSRPQQLRKVMRPEDQRVRGSDDGKRPGVWTGPDFGSFPPWPLAPPDLSNSVLGR
jgi:hypothetical protein